MPRVRLRQRLLEFSRTRRFRLIAIGGVAVLLVVGLLAIASRATSNPSFCVSCHEMQREVRSWAKSPHSEVTCYGCHAGSGLASLIGAKFELVGFVLRHISGLYEDPINPRSEVQKSVSTEACVRCHTTKRVVTPRRGIVIDHRIHPKKGIACTECHNRVSHPGLRDHRDFMRMVECFRCHGVEKTAKATGRCDKCHTSQFDLVPGSHKKRTWRVPDHSVAAKKDRRACRMCHREAFCTSCHRLPMPHPFGWARPDNLHAKVGTRNRQVCTRCHARADSCTACHHAGYNPQKGPWINQHFRVALSKGVYLCVQCHELTFCARCHTRGGTASVSPQLP